LPFHIGLENKFINWFLFSGVPEKWKLLIKKIIEFFYKIKSNIIISTFHVLVYGYYYYFNFSSEVRGVKSFTPIYINISKFK